MKQSEMKAAPSLGGWLIAAAAGLVAAAVAYVVGDFNYSQAGFVGLIIFVVVGFILGLHWGSSAAARQASGDLTGIAAPMADTTVAAAGTAMAPAAAPSMPALAEEPAAMMSMAPVGDAAPAKTGPAARAKTNHTPAKPAAAKAIAEPAAAKPPAAKAPRAKKADGPLRLSAPRKGKADNLKEIEGIGPALEKLCNGLGFYHFDQIANWSDTDVAWVDANMQSFKGRIVRDKWIAQSKIIVTEGLEAFRVRAKTNDY